MSYSWLKWLNVTLICAVSGFCVATYVFFIRSPTDMININQKFKHPELPKNAFMQPLDDYAKMGGSLLALAEAPPVLQVPDLRSQLMYHGKNGRPDAQSENTFLHFSFSSSKSAASIKPNEILYITYDRTITPARYTFSTNNQPTSLWIEPSVLGNEAEVKVTMLSHDGQKITYPPSNSCFRITEKEAGRISAWDIGSMRFDGTILARQKARWYGVDRFLENHGGNEYQHTIGKQRIDFGENDTIYSVFVKVGDCLVWKEDHWQVLSHGEESAKMPLLVIKKVDDRLISFELWDAEGKGKIILNLLKSSDPWTMRNPQMIQQMFKFVGTRTHTKFIFELNGERMVISPCDWLLLTTKGWKNLCCAEDIDAYVGCKLTGTLFVFEEIKRKEERQVIKGRLYSPMRNDFEIIEIILQSETAKAASESSGKDDKEKDKDKNKEDKEEKIIPLKRSFAAYNYEKQLPTCSTLFLNNLRTNNHLNQILALRWETYDT